MWIAFRPSDGLEREEAVEVVVEAKEEERRGAGSAWRSFRILAGEWEALTEEDNDDDDEASSPTLFLT